MKIKRALPFSIVLSILFPLLLPGIANAVPKRVTFFPGSARVTDVTPVFPQPSGPGEFKAVVTLPGQALPDSLTIRVDPAAGLTILDQSWRQIDRPDQGRAAELQRLLQLGKTERIAILSAIQALDSQIKFWQAQARAKTRTPEETAGLAAQIGRNIQKDLQEKLTLEPELEKLDKRIREYQEELARIAGQKEKIWEVSLTLNGSALPEVALTLTYTLNGCGWLPLYRLDARPRDGVILFAWDAEIWQSSAIDWREVDTELATLQPNAALTPPDLPPWVIRPRPQLRPQGRQKSELLAAPMAAQEQPKDAQDMVPRETRQTTFAVWSLGEKTIPAGSTHRLKIREEQWKADFLHLLRPSLTAQSFLRATVRLPEGSEIPTGSATYLIDGASAGKRPFSLAGPEATLFFGIDPLVTAKSILLSRKSGEKGLIIDQQTQEWAWRLEIINGGSSTIRARLEEPLPQPRDERIKIALQSEPEMTEKGTSEMVWRMDVPAGQKRSIMNTIRLSAPKEIDLDLGWRR